MVNISLFASAARPQWWERLYESLQDNQCNWEIVFVGPNPPEFKLPYNFKYHPCNFKPTQCYAAASYLSRGELMGWTADDAVYPPYSLDKIWEAYQDFGAKCIYAQHTIENNKDVTEEHYFFRYNKTTPRMAPMAFMNRNFFWECGGYDRNHIAGQAENSILMEAYSKGGEVRIVDESKVYLNHEEVHGGIINKLKYKFGKNSFRSGYWDDRRYLEECWILPNSKISKIRLLPLHSFNYNNILTVAQGPQGRFIKCSQ